MIVIFFADFVPGLIAWRGTGFWKKNSSPKDHAQASIGCYQYNLHGGGDIRFLKACGASQTGSCCAPHNPFSDSPDSPDPPAPSGGLCLNDIDCLSNKGCKTNENCPQGSCINSSGNSCIGTDTSCYCQGQKCDSTGSNPTFTCLPCPSPVGSIEEQIKSLSICTGGYPLSTCPVSGLICQIKTKDKDGVHGACPSCDEEGHDPETCAKTDDGWLTTAVCNDGLSLVTALENMRQYQDNWVPQSVPVITWVIVVIGIVSFVLTGVWYIKYLIQHGKK